MAKVYVVWFDNCECYEDNYQEIESVHATNKGAMEHIQSIIEKYELENKLIQVDVTENSILNSVKMWVCGLKIPMTQKVLGGMKMPIAFGNLI